MLAYAFFLGLSFGAAGIGSLLTRRGLGAWYGSLRKPSWTPSGRVIGAVWAVLYALMGTAAFLTWRRGGPAARSSLGLFGVHLGLNVGWSAAFFALRRPGLALGEIGVLWLIVASWLVSTWRVDRRAGWLIAPYLAWVAFAAALNASIWRLNSQDRGRRG